MIIISKMSKSSCRNVELYTTIFDFNIEHNIKTLLKVNKHKRFDNFVIVFSIAM